MKKVKKNKGTVKTSAIKVEVFKCPVTGKYFELESDYKAFRDGQEKRKEALATIKEIDKKMDALETQENRQWTERDRFKARKKAFVDSHPDVVRVVNLIDQYDRSIKKAELAINMCRKSLLNQRREAAKQYKDTTYNPRLMSSISRKWAKLYDEKHKLKETYKIT